MKKKIITEDQLKYITDTLFQLNIPVQAFTGLQKLLTELPEVGAGEEKKG